jgi:6-pyruvoyltetrahydropterin/6-carboxytetrahydropterin synthase
MVIYLYEKKMPLVYLTRKEQFNAAHKLFNPLWTEEENERVFGPCSNKNWHGHNYDLWVTVKGQPHPDSGFVVDLKQLSTLIRARVIDKLDHKNLNLDVAFMEGIFSSTENLAVQVWWQLQNPISELGCTLHSIRIAETERNSVEYFGD